MKTAPVIDATKTKQRPRLGICAGEGKLPSILAQSATEKGYDVYAYALSEDALNRISPHCYKAVQIAPGQIGRNMKNFKKENVPQAVFIGKVPKLNLLQNLYKFDWTAVKELSKLPNFNDDTIQTAMGDFMERSGIEVLTQRQFLSHLFPEIGVLTKRQPTVAEYADIKYGMELAKKVAKLDIGQTVVVRDRMILAVEAIEGTDEAIKRGANLARGPVVVAKVAKAKHDQRFDTPTIGMNTLKAMIGKYQGGVIAIGANETMVVDREELVEFADQNEISLVVVEAPDIDPTFD